MAINDKAAERAGLSKKPHDDGSLYFAEPLAAPGLFKARFFSLRLSVGTDNDLFDLFLCLFERFLAMRF